MTKILVLAEQKDGKLKKATKELLGAASGREVYAVLFGSDANDAADELASRGVKTVYWIKDPQYDNYHPEAYTKAVSSLLEKLQPQYFWGSASGLGKDLMPRALARLDASLAADCIELKWEPELMVRRPFFSGKANAWIRFKDAPITGMSFRPNALEEGQVSAEKGQVEEYSVDFDFGSSAIQFVEKVETKSDRPELTEANIIMSGGRSLKAKENFKILYEAADLLGAAVGASRAAVDDGLAPHDMQVGQTGKTVNPSLYIACGISGAIQHLAGMRTSKVIVAINKDDSAPIFKKADYGVVADLFEFVPAFTQELKNALGK